MSFPLAVFLNFFVFNGEAPRIFSLKLINIIKKQNNSTHLVLRFHRHTDWLTCSYPYQKGRVYHRSFIFSKFVMFITVNLSFLAGNVLWPWSTVSASPRECSSRMFFIVEIAKKRNSLKRLIKKNFRRNRIIIHRIQTMKN